MNDPVTIDSGLTVIAVFCDLLIAAGYLMLGTLVARKFDAAAPTWVLQTFKGAGLVFFIMCALTHVHHADHVIRDLPDDPTSVHFLLIHVLQAVAALTSSILGLSFVSLRIYDVSYYGSFLDRAIDRQAREAAALIQLTEVENIATEAKRVSDMAELMRSVYTGEAVK